MHHRQQTLRAVQTESRVAQLVPQLTLDEKISLVHGNSKFSIAAVERLGIHEMWMSDGPHSVRAEIERHTWDKAGWTDDQATYLPPLTTVAASWNLEMAKLHGNVLGSEARHRRKDLILGPGVNLAQNPLNGRNFEYLGEDPYLTSRMAVAEINAIQANDVGATVKHFALNTQELKRTEVDALPDERTLREVYLAAFEAAVKEANVYAIMGAYNRFRGTNANQSKHLVKDILKGEWGYPHILLTDWNVDINTTDAALNGLDIEMGTEKPTYDDYFFGNPLKEKILAGEIPESVLDDKVSRILRVQHSIGMYDKYRLAGERNTAAHQAAARTIAEEGAVLLKNDGLLPLNKQAIKRLLVLGPNADTPHGGGGGSSEAKALYEITPLAGLREALGEQVEITHLRIRDDDQLHPIAGDYIAHRHWTGTTAWNFTRYQDRQRKQVALADWLPDAHYKVPDGRVETLSFDSVLRPLQTGRHTFKLLVDGQYRISLDGKVLAEGKSDGKAPVSHSVALSPRDYTIRLDATSRGQITLGWDTPEQRFVSLTDALTAAQAADTVIYVGGLSHADDRESIDRTDLKLPGGQDNAISQLLRVKPDTVLLMIGGAAVEMPWVDRAQAILWGWYGGMEAGRAYANLLFGEVNPSGKLPVTFPRQLADVAPIALNDYNGSTARYSEGVFIGHRWFDKQNIEPLFAFGHGLSYSTFRYSNLALASNTLQQGETLTVGVDITNTSNRAGAEVVQLYLRDLKASVERPIKELKGFQKVKLAAGETRRVTLELKPRDLAFWDVGRNDWTAEPGEFELMIGSSSRDIRQQARFTLLP